MSYIGIPPQANFSSGLLDRFTSTTGTIWVDNGTSGKLKVKINDGSDNVELFEIDISSNAITSNMSVTGTITETDPNALPLALALG